MKTNLNLIFYNTQTNFGDQLSPFILDMLINKEKYSVSHNKPGDDISIVMIGSYIHQARNNSYIYGSGVRTDPPIECYNNYSKLNICAVRGPITKAFLEGRGFNVPEIFGDPALLLPLFYKPITIAGLSNKIAVVPHKSNYNKYKAVEKDNRYLLINPHEGWRNVINKLASCKCIISSSLHGLICSDAYNKPNIWLDEYPLQEGDLKFKDYFMSQSRGYIKITRIEDFNESQLYTKGNTIDLEKLRNAFPFR
jgi:pyruvyltransferase